MDRTGFSFCLRVNDVEQACRVKQAASAWQRLRGLLLCPPLKQDEALWIRPCNSIHMFGMRYPIDAVFLDTNGVVLQVRRSVAPGHVAACWRAKSVLETASGACEVFGIRPGATLSMTMKT
jgi:uncharacterized protein